MKESTTYRAILAEGIMKGIEKGMEKGMEKGKVEEARKILLRIGSKLFGPPDSRSRTLIEETDDIERLEQMAECLLDVASWDELLTPSTMKLGATVVLMMVSTKR